MSKLSVVTIVFKDDMELLRLQARSMAKFVDPDAVTDVLLVLNDVDEAAIRARLDEILPDYGPLHPKVRVVGGDELFYGVPRSKPRSLFERIYVDNRHRLPFLAGNGWRGGNGYRMQQALKLASARVARSERMLILDAKNVFLRALDPDEFFDGAGRALALRAKTEPQFHKDWLSESLKVLEVDIDPASIDETITYSTPYPVCRAVMLRVLDEVSVREGSVQALFASKKRPSEFMLIVASCLKNEGNYDRFFGSYGGQHLGLWKGYSSDVIDEIITKAEAAPSVTFGLHRKLLPLLNADQRARIIALFAARELDVTGLFGAHS